MSIQAQDLISTNILGVFPEALIELNFDTDVDNGVSLYKMLYTTTDLEGRLDTASGLVAVPFLVEDDLSLLAYQHGTVDGPDDVPSKLKGGYELALVYGAYGFLTIAPDMLGLGDSRGFHPYVHAASEASACVDMLFAVRQFAQEEGITLTDQLFVTGYSQGGHAAMAAHRSLEQDFADNFPVTASAPMSGPYDISGKMSEFTLGDGEYGFVAYLAYTALSYQEAYKNLFSEGSLEEFFKPAYVEDILLFKNNEIGLFELNDRLISTLILEEGRSVPKLMLQPEVLDGILNDPMHPASVALRDNDVYDWAPKSPTRLYYCTADEQVWFENSLTAEAVMKANGATDVEAISKGSLSHGQCVFPAVLDAVEWFKGIRDLSSSTLEIGSKSITIYPSPADQQIYIETPEDGIEDNSHLRILDTQGKVWINQGLRRNLTVDTAPLPNGVYLIQLQIDNQMKTHKFVVQH